MAFEWDARKNAVNLAKHGIEFADATRMFEGAVLERLDDREDYGETRIAAVGVVEGRELFVVYTMRGENRRIISARKANRHERQAYHQALRAHQGQD
ncbi:MAG: BrnT family toxin [Proteobacteria bacterium]|nr:BrnT family toxin [Pseudomonadota bacterium]